MGRDRDMDNHMKMGNALAEENTPALAKMLNEVYHTMEGSEASMAYSERHNVKSTRRPS